MNILLFTPDRNKEGLKDYDGAFKVEAHRFANLYVTYPKDVIKKIDISQSRNQMRVQVTNALKNQEPNSLDLVAFFCHGWTQGIQLGFNIDSAAELAANIGLAAKPTCKIVLYCCSCGKNEDGFADLLRDLSSFQVDAHSSVRHTTSNPDVIRFDAGPPSVGGDWLVRPTDPLFKIWEKVLADRDSLIGDLRFRFPFMTREEILSYLKSI